MAWPLIASAQHYEKLSQQSLYYPDCQQEIDRNIGMKNRLIYIEIIQLYIDNIFFEDKKFLDIKVKYI